MKDYFAALISTGVTGETRGNSLTEHRETDMFNEHWDVTPKTLSKGNKGNKRFNLLHHVTPPETDSVTLRGNETAGLHPLHHVTPRNDNLRYLYHERAAIMEFDRGESRHEAERLAYQDALNTFLIDKYPEIVGQFEAIIHQSFLN